MLSLLKMFTIPFDRKRLSIICTLLLFTAFPLRAQQVYGIWENVSENIVLELHEDSSGSLKIGQKYFEFDGPYIMNESGLLHHLNFTILVGSVKTPCYAILKQVDSTTLIYISFLAKQLRDDATQEVIDAGVRLTKKL